MTIKKPLIIGLGGVGGLLASFLKEAGMQVTAMDQKKPKKMPAGIKFVAGDVTNAKALLAQLKNHDAVISCLPFNLTIDVAKAAHKAGVFYFDPTEDVATTTAVRKLAKTAKKAMVPQCGLAPGVIGIIGSHLAGQFDKGTLRHLKLRVGALPRNPTGQLGYSGNWSLAGLVHEYIADCDVIANGKRQKVLPLRNHEILRIDGSEYEAFTTSGGLGTMTETYSGKIQTLDYKSIRYRGHLDAMKLLLEDLRFRENPDELVKRLGYALPPDDEDHVLIHVSAEGAIKGRLQTKTLVAKLDAITVAGSMRPAILWTTAASIAAVIEMVSNGALKQKGFVKQEDISLPEFLKTKHGKLYAKQCPKLSSL
ncbi:MAG TPA: saccharopine dehydrogenase C-terminal domain-containing protein [Alphaproteobacteria bacterium]|nr:saccharopine dehydrogenase C-terminal domain-containing protein [Alphaproteobacteria bacterium]